MTDLLLEPPARSQTWLAGIGQLTTPTLALLVPTALLGNLALQTGLSVVVAPVAVMIGVAFLWRAGAFTRPSTKALVAAAVVLALWLPLRDSPWLTALNTLTCGALIVAAVVFDKHPVPRLTLRSFGELVGRATAGLAGPALVARSLLVAVPGGRVRSNESLVAVARGLAIAVLPVLILGAFLAQADAVFASAFSFDLNAGSFMRHGALSAFVALAVSGLVCIGRVGSTEDPGRPGSLRTLEVATVLGCIFVLFGAFAASQVVGAFVDVDTILATQGMTHADYARSGFFQLLSVAALTLVILSALQALVRPDSSAIDNVRRALGAGVCLLTVLIVAVSINRLGLYVDAFGQTTLRWYSTAFAWLLGAVFVMFAAQHVATAPRPWFGRAASALVMMTLLAVNVVNPEHRVAEHNLTNEPTEAALDARYLIGLSADAWPLLVEHIDELTTDESQRSWSAKVPLDVFIERCTHKAKQAGFGIAGGNLARYRLACPTGRG